MYVTCLRLCVCAVIEPRPGGIALEAVYGSAVGNLDCTDFIDRDWKQEARITGGSAACRRLCCAIMQLYCNDRPDQ